MLRLAADENFNKDIVRGLLQGRLDLDILRVQDAGLAGRKDAEILAWAAQQGRLLLTHDFATMSAFAYDRVRAGLPMPGVIQVRQDLAIGRAIDDILLIAGASTAADCEAQVLYLPL